MLAHSTGIQSGIPNGKLHSADSIPPTPFAPGSFAGISKFPQIVSFGIGQSDTSRPSQMSTLQALFKPLLGAQAQPQSRGAENSNENLERYDKLDQVERIAKWNKVQKRRTEMEAKKRDDGQLGCARPPVDRRAVELQVRKEMETQIQLEVNRKIEEEEENRRKKEEEEMKSKEEQTRRKEEEEERKEEGRKKEEEEINRRKEDEEERKRKDKEEFEEWKKWKEAHAKKVDEEKDE